MKPLATTWTSSRGPNPYFFIVGCARSGTTLLQRLADAHPELAVMHGTRWIARLFEARRVVTADGRITRELVAALLAHPRFKALELEPEALWEIYDGSSDAAYADLVAAIFDRFGLRHGKRLVGDKTPEYAQSVTTLSQLWPHTRFVHIVRDGRDVHLSVAQWGKGAVRWPTWHDDPVGTTATWWELNVRLAREAGSRLGAGRYHELRYESLVANAAGECARLCAFLGVPYDEAMLSFNVGRTMSRPDGDAKRSWLPVTAGLRDWRREMPPADIARFEAVAGDLLEELGYERADRSSPDRQGVEHPARLGFIERARRQRRAIPEAWQGGTA